MFQIEETDFFALSLLRGFHVAALLSIARSAYKPAGTQTPPPWKQSVYVLRTRPFLCTGCTLQVHRMLTSIHVPFGNA